MPEPSDYLLVLCTAPPGDEASDPAPRLARALVERRLAACVNILPRVRSFYTWEHAVHDDPECQLLIKTTRERFDALRTWLLDAHPYDEPEIIAVPLTDGSPGYLRWIDSQIAMAPD